MPSIRAVPKLDFTASCLPSSWDSSSSVEATSPGSSPAKSFCTSISTEMPMGSIITAVAVLETHMERKPVAIMNPAISADGLEPIMRRVSRATRRCRFQRCIASASMNPPMNRKMMLLP